MSFLSQLSSVASELSSAAVDIVKNKTELEKKLDEALSKASWGASSSLLREIARHTHYPYDFPVIMKAVWGALNHSGKNWRQIYKGLVLLEALIKYGTERCVDEARAHIFRVRTLQEFSYYDGPRDHGAGIREISKRLVDLLAEDDRLREERKKARELTSNVVGITNRGINYDNFNTSFDPNFNSRYGSHSVQAVTSGVGRSRYQSQDEGDKTWADTGDFSGFGSETTRGKGREPAGRRVGRRGSTASASGTKTTSTRRQSLIQNAASSFEPFGTEQATIEKDDAFDFFGPQTNAPASGTTQSAAFDASDFDSFGPPASATPAQTTTSTTTAPTIPAPRRPSRTQDTSSFSSFDAFGPSSTQTSAPTQASNATASSSAANVLDDIFSVGSGSAPAAAAASADPFSSVAPSQSTTQQATTATAVTSDPFGGDVFGSFTTPDSNTAAQSQQNKGKTDTPAVTTDSDISRLVSLDPFNFSSTSTETTQTPKKPSASLATLMGSTSAKKSTPVMQNNATVSMAIDYSLAGPMSPGMPGTGQQMNMQGMGMQNMGMMHMQNPGMQNMNMQGMGMQNMGMQNMGMQNMGMGMQSNMGMQQQQPQQQTSTANVNVDPFASFF